LRRSRAWCGLEPFQDHGEAAVLDAARRATYPIAFPDAAPARVAVKAMVRCLPRAPVCLVLLIGPVPPAKPAKP